MTQPNKPFGDTEATHAHLAGGEKFSPLAALQASALRRYGDINAANSHSEVDSMFIELANEIVEEYNRHPYVTEPISDYIHSQDFREIPDPIIIAGLTYLYAEQQSSKKADLLRAKFFRTLNGQLHRLTYGKQQIEVRPMDGGSKLSESEGTA